MICSCLFGAIALLAKMEVVLLQALYHAAPEYIHIQTLNYEDKTSMPCTVHTTSVYDLILFMPIKSTSTCSCTLKQVY